MTTANKCTNTWMEKIWWFLIISIECIDETGILILDMRVLCLVLWTTQAYSDYLGMLGFSFFEGGDFAERGKAIIQGYCPEHFIVTDHDDRKKKLRRQDKTRKTNLELRLSFFSNIYYMLHMSISLSYMQHPCFSLDLVSFTCFKRLYIFLSRPRLCAQSVKDDSSISFFFRLT